jgi:hypothetical protein
LSLSLHVAIIVYALTATHARREERPTAPVVVTVMLEQSPLVPPPAPALVAQAPAVAQGRAGKPAVAQGQAGKPAARLRSDRAVNREAPASPAPASADKEPALAATVAPNLQGDVVVQAPNAVVGSGTGPAGGVAAAARGPDTSGAPRILAPAEGDGQLAINPNEARYQPVIPPPLRKPGAKFAPLVKLCVRKDGLVGDVIVMRPSDPAVDPAIVEKLRLFKFRPYLDHGRPIPFCFFREYRLSVEE